MTFSFHLVKFHTVANLVGDDCVDTGDVCEGLEYG